MTVLGVLYRILLHLGACYADLTGEGPSASIQPRAVPISSRLRWPVRTVDLTDAIDVKVLLSVLAQVKAGDFTARMPLEWTVGRGQPQHPGPAVAVG